jgi:hypothetical protein
MIIDCDTCEVRGKACADCVVSFLTIGMRPADPIVELAPDVSAAVQALSDGGLVPPLRLVSEYRAG